MLDAADIVRDACLRAEYAESRADHGLEKFGDSLYPYGRNGRHVGTRTPDLYRVNFEVLNLEPFSSLAFPILRGA